ncbi:hypothetical protein BH10BAC3_BH10BAC3_06300 [soil metagenome]
MATFSEAEKSLRQHSVFPVNAFVWEKGKSVYEFPFIQKLAKDDYIVHSQRHYALNPFELAEKATWEFTSLKKAFQKWNDLENGVS